MARVIHIAGLPRSGTTLLQAFLMTDPQTCTAGGECALPGLVADMYSKLSETWDDDTHYFFPDKDAMRVFCEKVIDEFLHRYAREVESSKVFVLKNTDLSRSVGFLRELRPQDDVLCVIRDPRDYIASHLNIIDRRRTSGLQTMNNSELDEWIEVLSKEAAECLRIMTQTPNCSWIRYEDFVSRPDVTARMLKEKFGLNCLPDRVWSRMNFSFLRSSKSDNRFAASPDWERPITTRNVGRYKELLAERQVEIVERQCAAVMKEFRYL